MDYFLLLVRGELENGAWLSSHDARSSLAFDVFF